jgi:type IV pilus assembly protein PilV
MRNRQRGSSLLEGLVSIGVFAIGLLGLAGMTTQLMQQGANAQFRAQASYMAEELIGLATADVANVDCYRMTASGPNACGNAVATAAVADWRARALAAFPGASAAPPTVTYANDGTLTVTILWQRPQETTQHNHVSITNLYPGT